LEWFFHFWKSKLRNVKDNKQQVVDDIQGR
jgi:hypothetical protein